MYLLFDLDGTLTNPFQGITRGFSFTLTALSRPIPPQDSLKEYIGPPLKNGLAELLKTNDEKLIDEAIHNIPGTV